MTKGIVRLGLIVGFWLISCVTYAQLPPGQYTTKNKKAIKLLEAGKQAYGVQKDKEAEKSWLKAIELDKNFIEAYLGLGNLYQVIGQHESAISYYKQAISINPSFYPYAFYFLAESELRLGKYKSAKEDLLIFLKLERINPNTKENAQRMLLNAEFGIQAVMNPQPFKPVNAGPGINTTLNEYFPAMSADGSQFLFTRGLIFPEQPDRENEDFFLSLYKEGKWQLAQPIREINSQGNEGAPALSANGNIMFFASCSDEFGDYGSQDRKGFGSCDIFYSQKINGRWTRPRNAGPNINTGNWETQPSFSSDGKTLYFIRGVVKPGGVREQDIWSSHIGEDGRFQPAVKLTDVINTPLKEESVFIHPDNQTIYFSSEGHPGMGGLDIFMSKRGPDGNWTKPINLGYPINTYNDENSLLVDPAGNLAFFASDRTGGEGGLDIYYFEIPEGIRPEPITYVKGKIYNSRTKEPLEARFELIDLQSQNSVAQSQSEPDGSFFMTLTSGKNYMVNVSKDGFLFYSGNFSLQDVRADIHKPYLIDIPLDPIDTGYVVELKNVFFDVNKWELKGESTAELDKLIRFLVKNPRVKIEISGHTDNTGERKNNLLLSGNRAKAVYDYLILQGKIDPTRLTYKGYADMKPLVPNDTPENKARNRRTEFKVIGK